MDNFALWNSGLAFHFCGHKQGFSMERDHSFGIGSHSCTLYSGCSVSSSLCPTNWKCVNHVCWLFICNFRWPPSLCPRFTATGCAAEFLQRSNPKTTLSTLVVKEVMCLQLKSYGKCQNPEEEKVAFEMKPYFFSLYFCFVPWGMVVCWVNSQ